MRIDVAIALHHSEDVDEFMNTLWGVLATDESLEHFNYMFTVEPEGEGNAGTR
jgi:hypothetical protein